MKNFQVSIIAALLFAAIGQPLAAQTVKSPVVITKVAYSPKLPNALRQKVPAGGTTRFWGKSTLKHQRQPVWAHVYDVQKTDFDAEFDPKDYAPVDFMHDPRDGVQKSALDLWFQDKSRQWQRISHVEFDYLRFGEESTYVEEPRETRAAFEWVGVDTFWLNTKAKTKPIFQVDFINPKGFLGRHVLHMWVIFANGLEQKPVVQAFQDAYSGLGTWSLSVVSSDMMGNVLVRYHHWSHGSGVMESTLKWRGKRFEE